MERPNQYVEIEISHLGEKYKPQVGNRYNLAPNLVAVVEHVVEELRPLATLVLCSLKLDEITPNIGDCE